MLGRACVTASVFFSHEECDHIFCGERAPAWDARGGVSDGLGLELELERFRTRQVPDPSGLEAFVGLTGNPQEA